MRNVGNKGHASNVRVCNYCMMRSSTDLQQQKSSQQQQQQSSLTSRISQPLNQAMGMKLSASLRQGNARNENQADDAYNSNFQSKRNSLDENASSTLVMRGGSPEDESHTGKAAKSQREVAQSLNTMFKGMDTISPGMRTRSGVLQEQYDEEDFTIEECDLADTNLSVEIDANENCLNSSASTDQLTSEGRGEANAAFANQRSRIGFGNDVQVEEGSSANGVSNADLQTAARGPDERGSLRNPQTDEETEDEEKKVNSIPDVISDLCLYTEEVSDPAAETDGTSPRSERCEKLDKFYRLFLARYVSQLCTGEGLTSTERKAVWAHVIVDLALRASSRLKLEGMQNINDMDPHSYVKIKKLQTGDDPTNSKVVEGLVFRKNVAHRRMRSNIPLAKIMLIRGALQYQRVENKLASFDTLLDQEREHLRVIVARIALHSPDVVSNLISLIQHPGWSLRSADGCCRMRII